MAEMYKIYFENRFICISGQPDRVQNYCLFHKFHDQKALYDQIDTFLDDASISCINIYSYKLDHLWKLFIEKFHYIEASGGIVIDSNKRMLLIKRYKHWDAPKGHFEPGETPAECARREIKEECGVECGEIITSLAPKYHLYKFENEYYMKMTHWFLFALKGSSDTTPQLEEGITDAVWIESDRLIEVKEFMWSSVKDVVNEALQKHFHHL